MIDMILFTALLTLVIRFAVWSEQKQIDSITIELQNSYIRANNALKIANGTGKKLKRNAGIVFFNDWIDNEPGALTNKESIGK